MFEQTFVQTQAQTRKPWTVAVSLSLQFMAVGIVLLIPLLHPDSLRIPGPPQPHLIRTWITLPPLPPQRTATHSSPTALPATSRVFVYRRPTPGPIAPQSIELPTSDAEPNAWAGPAGAAFGPALTTSVALPPVTPAPRPVPPPSPKPPVSGPLKVGGDVAAAKLIYGPAPIYPRLAQMARSQG